MCKIKLSDLKKGKKYIDQDGFVMEIEHAIFTVKSPEGHIIGMSLNSFVEDVERFLPEQDEVNNQ